MFMISVGIHIIGTAVGTKNEAWMKSGVRIARPTKSSCATITVGKPNQNGATDCKSNVVCDALILDPESRSDTYPYIEVEEDDVAMEHEASVSKIAEEQLLYLMSRGLTEAEASSMIVTGFIEPLVKELPMEYAVELNRLIELQMEGSVG